ncbi:MAG: hypothetical protein ACC608_00885 [Anaerofustis sp.]
MKSLLTAFVVAFTSVAAIGAAVIGSGMLFGFQRLWLTLVIVTLFMATEKTPSKKSMIHCALGSLYGIVLGYVFSFSAIGFLIGVVLTVTCLIAGKLPEVMNNYAILIFTIFTIGGVSTITMLWQDAISFVLSLLVIFLITMGAEKKARIALQTAQS